MVEVIIVSLVCGVLAWFYGLNGYRYHKRLMVIEGLLLSSIGTTVLYNESTGGIEWFHENVLTLMMGVALLVLTIFIWKCPVVLAFFAGASVGVVLAVALSSGMRELLVFGLLFGGIGGIGGIYYTKTMIILHTAIPGTYGAFIIVGSAVVLLEERQVINAQWLHSVVFTVPLFLMIYGLNVTYQWRQVFVTKVHDCYEQVMNRPIPMILLCECEPQTKVKPQTPEDEKE